MECPRFQSQGAGPAKPKCPDSTMRPRSIAAPRQRGRQRAHRGLGPRRRGRSQKKTAGAEVTPSSTSNHPARPGTVPQPVSANRPPSPPPIKPIPIGGEFLHTVVRLAAPDIPGSLGLRSTTRTRMLIVQPSTQLPPLTASVRAYFHPMAETASKKMGLRPFGP